MTTLVSHEIVRFLQARGVSHVFGLCGHPALVHTA